MYICVYVHIVRVMVYCSLCLTHSQTRTITLLRIDADGSSSESLDGWVDRCMDGLIARGMQVSVMLVVGVAK